MIESLKYFAELVLALYFFTIFIVFVTNVCELVPKKGVIYYEEGDSSHFQPKTASQAVASEYSIGTQKAVSKSKSKDKLERTEEPKSIEGSTPSLKKKEDTPAKTDTLPEQTDSKTLTPVQESKDENQKPVDPAQDGTDGPMATDAPEASAEPSSTNERGETAETSETADPNATNNDGEANN